MEICIPFLASRFNNGRVHARKLLDARLWIREDALDPVAFVARGEFELPIVALAIPAGLETNNDPDVVCQQKVKVRGEGFGAKDTCERCGSYYIYIYITQI